MRTITEEGASTPVVIVIAVIAAIVIVGAAYAAGESSGHSSNSNPSSLTVSQSSITSAGSSSSSSAGQVKLVITTLNAANPSYMTFTVNNTGSSPADILTLYVNNTAIHSLSGNSKACTSKSIPTQDDCIAPRSVTTFSVLLSNSTKVSPGASYSFSFTLDNGQTFGGKASAI